MRNYGQRNRTTSENYHLEPAESSSTPPPRVGYLGDAPPPRGIGDSNYSNDRGDGLSSALPATTFESSWSGESRTSSVWSGLSGLYAMILVIVYVAFSFTELVTFPENQKILEKNGFFLYLFLVADGFLIYIFVFTLRGDRKKKRDQDDFRIVENHRSHGSLTIRFGAVIFGIGTLIYMVLELVSFLEIEAGSPCHYPILGANVIASILMVILQTYLIFVFPRLNLRIWGPVDTLGSMHIVATNIIVWIRTLIKESLHEITESEEEAHKVAIAAPLSRAHLHGTCNIIGDRIAEARKIEESCAEYHRDILGDTLLKSSPFLYPFVIEYALIGASVIFIMWRHVGKLPLNSANDRRKIRKPAPRQFLKKGDWSHSCRGLLAGFVMLTLALLNLCLFFGLDGHDETEPDHIDEAEYFSKTTNTIINSLGIVGLIYGLVQIQQLDHNDDRDEDERSTSDLDLALLRFTAFFAYLYLTFTIITGAFNNHVANFPNELHIINGVVEAIQISLQICFIVDLKRKALPLDLVDSKPGRQVTVFLFLLNLSQWFVFTFEIQKVRASLVEAEFYGFMPWVIIQRVTLPLTVFFRFHSAVVNIELWKDVYGK